MREVSAVRPRRADHTHRRGGDILSSRLAANLPTRGFPNREKARGEVREIR